MSDKPRNRSEYFKAYRAVNADKIKEYVASNRDKRRAYHKSYRKSNLPKIHAKQKAWRESNPEHYKALIASWKEANPSYMKEYARVYQKQRGASDPLFRLAGNTRALIRVSLNGVTKHSRSEEILGCSMKFFKSHIEQRFLPGMSWENRGLWHLDHIIPVSSAKTEKQLLKLNHYTNFRPLWAKDNQRKSAKLTEQLTLIAA